MLQPLTEQEKKYAEKHHNLVYSFLHRNGYCIEEYYNIVIFGFLKGVQDYHRREDIRERYEFPCVCWYYCRAEMGNHFRIKNAQKRKPLDPVASLDADYNETGNLYNRVGRKSVEADVMEKELIKSIMENLSDRQRKITQLKMAGYNNKEVYFMIGIPSSTYYREMQEIRAIVGNLIG